MDSKEQTTIRLPTELKEQLHREAERRGYTMTDLIMFIFYRHCSEAIHQE